MAKKNSWLNYVSEKMIHQNQTAEGKEFANISIACPNSKTGLATIAVNLGQILDSTKKDGSVVDGMKNVLLGAPEKTRKVSILKGGQYETVEMTNAQIVKAVAESRKAYRAAEAEA